ncbi:unnamed protein product [Moneuplotes crassus]|uniref:Uncharacterized protein n=1 Tax=Euplotes crassus TaxID=5936 RepID=A0AAD1X4L9_EUPCR|nr:unnamed protein product [Moneuplotes crassus]
MKRIGLKVLGVFRGADLYGKTITLHYKGEGTFKTYCGGCVSVVIICLCLFYAIFLTRAMIRKEEITFTTNNIVRDVSVDLDAHKPAEKGFSIAFGFRDQDLSVLSDNAKRYFKIWANQFSRQLHSDGTITHTNTELELVDCKDHFPYYNKTLLSTFKIDNFACIKPLDYEITGNAYTDSAKYVEIFVQICDFDERSDCEYYDIIENFLLNAPFDVVMIDSYFDLENYTDPVQTYLDKKEYFLTLGTKTSSTITIKENNIETFDDYSLIKGKKDYKFYSVESERNSRIITPGDLRLAEATLQLDPGIQNNKRTVFNILDLLSGIGGLFSLIQSFAGVVVGIFAEKIFKHSVISKLYTCDMEEEKSDPDKHKDSKLPSESELNNEEGSNRRSLNNNSAEEGKIEEEKEPKNTSRKFEEQKCMGKKSTIQTLSDEKAEILIEKLAQRRRYNYSPLDWLYEIFCCCKTRKLCRRKYENAQHFSKGSDKYDLDLDVVNIISNIHQSNTMWKAIFDENQRALGLYSNDRSVGCIDVSIRSPLKNIKGLRCTNLLEDNDAICKLVQNLNKSGISQIDLGLIDQIGSSKILFQSDSQDYGVAKGSTYQTQGKHKNKKEASEIVSEDDIQLQFESKNSIDNVILPKETPPNRQASLLLQASLAPNFYKDKE